MKTYSNDPYWTTARFDSVDKQGQPVRKGTRIFYYPRTRTVLQGEQAEQASRDFAAAQMDEANYSGNW